MKKTLRLAALTGIIASTFWFSNAHAMDFNKYCDYKQGLACRFIGPSTPCQWMDGQQGYCGCVDRDHYECVRI
ncbi:MAG TPA: hypothetical protein VLB76_21045 [Thermoanaerobaculia bacterium]|jgi:hypothetical protein|nr:hypothetical protein [Thermoanaerobaculia bacterium]